VHWAEERHRLIPESQLLILENSGHFGHIEEPCPRTRTMSMLATLRVST
jgi:pimeloyl-ACP methyl ester carboxylesterase